MSHKETARNETQSTKILADFASNLTFDELPSSVINKVKTSLLDTIGCCLFSSTLLPQKKLASFAIKECGSGNSAIFGTEFVTTASGAALVNASGAHSFQLDEIHNRATLHPGSLAIPSVWALAEAEGIWDEKELIASIVAGYEVGIRVGLATNGKMFEKGYHNQGTSGVFAAAAASARILRLNTTQTQHALGIAGSQAAGLMAVQEGAMTKAFHSGRAAQSGVYGALLARVGYTGIPNVLEIPYGGFYSALIGENSLGEVLNNPGKEWEILKVGYKPYAASNGATTAMDALDEIFRKNNLTADEVLQVIVFVSTNTYHHCGWQYDPKAAQEVLYAQMNISYGLAVMATARNATVEQYSKDRMHEPMLLNFIEKVTVKIDPKYDENKDHRVAAKVKVLTKGGKIFEAEHLYRQGSDHRPMSNKRIEEKFIDLARRCMPERQAWEIVEALKSFSSNGGEFKVLRKLLRVSL